MFIVHLLRGARQLMLQGVCCVQLNHIKGTQSNLHYSMLYPNLFNSLPSYRIVVGDNNGDLGVFSPATTSLLLTGNSVPSC